MISAAAQKSACIPAAKTSARRGARAVRTAAVPARFQNTPDAGATSTSQVSEGIAASKALFSALSASAPIATPRATRGASLVVAAGGGAPSGPPDTVAEAGGY